jgi:hypothetical protein
VTARVSYRGRGRPPGARNKVKKLTLPEADRLRLLVQEIVREEVGQLQPRPKSAVSFGPVHTARVDQVLREIEAMTVAEREALVGAVRRAGLIR